MRKWRAWLVRFGGMFRKRESEVELSAELESHLQLHIADNLRAGMKPEEARREALMKLGGMEQTKQAYRDRRGLPWLETIWQDAKFGARMLRKKPGFTAVSVLTLALGIGATSAVFSIVNAVMLRPLPLKDSNRLVVLNLEAPMFPDRTLYLAWPAFQAVRREITSLEQSTVHRTEAKALTGRGDPQLLEVAAVSEGFFAQVGARAQMGRLLVDADSTVSVANVVVLSAALWRAHFGGNPGIVGQTITLDRRLYTVVGVAEREFAFPDTADAWEPLILPDDTKANPTFFAFEFLGKLKPGADLQKLQAELEVLSTQLQKQYPQLKDGYHLSATKLMEWEVGDARLALYALLGAAALLLLIACTNLASMLLSRGWGRQQEMAVRGALGASKGRIFRQLLVESCQLGFFGAGAGALLAAVGVQWFRILAPEDTPRLPEIHPDWALVAFAAACALLTGLLFGVAPARIAARAALQSALKEGTKGGGMTRRQSRMGGLLIAGEIALAFVLLTSAGLMLQTLQRLLIQSPGFPVENLLSFDLTPSDLQSDAERKQAAAAHVVQTQEILQQVQSLPGVESVAAVNYSLLNGGMFVHGGLHVEGSDTVDRAASFAVTARYVSPTYFQTLGLSLLRGREFDEKDSLESPSVTIVNAHMAKHYWGTLDVLGKRFSISTDEKRQELWSEIVGVVSDAREIEVRVEPDSEYYVPLYQGGAPGTSLLVRTTKKPQVMVSTIMRKIWSRYPDLPVTHVTTIRATIEKSVGNERLHAALLGVFAATGLLMALAGIYGVIAYAVERRTKEIGIRIAMGASRKNVLMLMSRHALGPVLLGIAAGLPAALLAQRAVSSELYGVKPSDPVTYVGAALLMLAVAALACLVPAQRANRVDPIVALHHQ
jgi:predicted permease